MRWAPYVFHRGTAFEEFWSSHLTSHPRDLLILAGLGFDPRACDAADTLFRLGGAGQRDAWLLCYDNNQLTTSEQQAVIETNTQTFDRLFAESRILRKLTIGMRSDRGRSTTCINTKAAVSHLSDLIQYNDVVVDISAMPRMIALMAVAQLIALFDERSQLDRGPRTSTSLHQRVSHTTLA
jgi:hypothetical protein